MTQPSFDSLLFRPSRIRPDCEESLACLIATLADHADWLTASDLSASLRANDRTIRQLAEQSHGHIISGQRGYKLTRLATSEEMQHSAAWLESQARKMSTRAGAIRRVWHAAPHRPA